MYNFIEEQVTSSLHYSMSLNKSWKTVLIKVYGGFSANSETLLAVAVHFCCRVQCECCKSGVITFYIQRYESELSSTSKGPK